MKILQFDSIGGASGDMILASLIDLGVGRDELQRQLTSLRVEPFDLQVVPFQHKGLGGKQVTIKLVHQPHDYAGKAHRHRGLKDIGDLINASALSRKVKDQSLRIFRCLAEAEAHVHGTTPGKIHFHEVGAVDSIIDIVGACLCLELLQAEAVAVGPLPMGRGTVQCEHGTLPIPVPATVELLKGFQVFQTDEQHELVTPTGAAILSAWKSFDLPSTTCRLIKSGNGFGHHILEGRHNLLRVFLLEQLPPGEQTDACLVLECNIDDSMPELLGSLSQQLIAAGALDAYITPVQMKKQRPGILLTVLCRSEHKETMLDLIFAESTTFGVREYPVNRTVLQRHYEEVKTPYGKVRVKVGKWKRQVATRTPEYEDCVHLAAQAGVSVRAVYEAALRAPGVLQAPQH